MLTRFRIRSTELRCADTDVAAPNSASIEVGYDLFALAGEVRLKSAETIPVASM